MRRFVWRCLPLTNSSKHYSTSMSTNDTVYSVSYMNFQPLDRSGFDTHEMRDWHFCVHMTARGVVAPITSPKKELRPYTHHVLIDEVGVLKKSSTICLHNMCPKNSSCEKVLKERCAILTNGKSHINSFGTLRTQMNSILNCTVSEGRVIRYTYLKKARRGRNTYQMNSNTKREMTIQAIVLCEITDCGDGKMLLVVPCEGEDRKVDKTRSIFCPRDSTDRYPKVEYESELSEDEIKKLKESCKVEFGLQEFIRKSSTECSRVIIGKEITE